MIADLAVVLDRGYDQRILPMAGFGSVRAIEDLLLLRGVDIAWVQADVLDFYKRAELFPDIGDKIRFLSKLYHKEFHLLASQDIRSIDDLEGRRVNFGPPSSGSFLTASLVFQALGLSVIVGDDDYHVALDKLRQGEIDAWVRVDAMPTRQISEAADLDGVHLLSVPVEAIGGDYLPAEISSKEYPALVPNGDIVRTLAVQTVMAVYAWSARHEKRVQLNSFYNDFAERLSRLQQPPFHQKWREVDLNADLSGWQRF